MREPTHLEGAFDNPESIESNVEQAATAAVAPLTKGQGIDSFAVPA